MQYKEIVELFKNRSVQYEIANPEESYPSLKMVGSPMPWSIKEIEFNTLREVIINNNLRTGYEIATAFGVSALAGGLGMAKTGGKLVTMDAYIEETCPHSSSYHGREASLFYDSKGFRSVSNIIDMFGLAGTICPEVGWSPTDTESCLRKHFNLTEEKLDFVLIDAGHWDSALLLDVGSIIPFLNKEKFVVFIHDTHCFSDGCLETVGNLLGGSVTYLENCRLPLGFNMTCVAKGVNTQVGECPC